MRLLDRKTILITGAGSGLGQALAVGCAQAGASVILVGRHQGKLEHVADQIRMVGGTALAIVADVTDISAVNAAVEQTEASIGPINVLIANAAVQGPIGPFVDSDVAEWMEAIDVNLGGTIRCCRVVLPGMLARQQGKIITVSGGGATGPRPYVSAYAAAKSAIVRLTETLAAEVQQYNVQVNAIAPGIMRTQMLEQVFQAGGQAANALQADIQRQIGHGDLQPDRAVALAIFLASDQSAGLTGKLIAAQYDPWETWSGEMLDRMSASSWYTLRRVDAALLKSMNSY